jgi:hypothetical protein
MLTDLRHDDSMVECSKNLLVQVQLIGIARVEMYGR